MFYWFGAITLLFTLLFTIVDQAILTEQVISERRLWFLVAGILFVMGVIMSRVSRGVIGETAPTYLPCDLPEPVPVETERMVCHESRTTILSFSPVPVTRGGIRGK